MPVSSEFVTDEKPLHERLQDLQYKAGLTQAVIGAAISRSQATVSVLSKPPAKKSVRHSADVIDGVRKLEARHRHLLTAA